MQMAMKKILALAAIVAFAATTIAQTPAVKTEKVKVPVEKKSCDKKVKPTASSSKATTAKPPKPVKK